MDNPGAENMEPIPLWGTILSRIDPPPTGWRTTGWARASNLAMSLAIGDGAIEVRGFGPLRGALEAFGGPRSLQPSQTVMWMTSVGESIGRWRVPWTEREWLALSSPLGDGTEYTLAVRPADGDFDRLRAALRMAGVSDA